MSEVTQRCKEGAKAVTPVCGSARAPALVLTFVHACFCSRPINPGDSQISFQRVSFLLLLAEQGWPNGCCCLPLKSSDGKRIYLSHPHCSEEQASPALSPVYALAAGVRGPERLAPNLTVRAWQSYSSFPRCGSLLQRHVFEVHLKDTILNPKRLHLNQKRQRYLKEQAVHLFLHVLSSAHPTNSGACYRK